MHLLLTSLLLLSVPNTPTHRPVSELWTGLRAVEANLEQRPELRAQWRRFSAEEGLSDAAFSDYVKVRLAFELTRDGGLWGLRWDITNRAPDSKAIWAQWAAAAAPAPSAPAPVTATAECDELSALFSLVAWKLGVDKVGLFWPTGNHTVAVWTAPSPTGFARVVVPTSQIFLDPDQTLGTDVFDPYAQRTIYSYHGSGDVSDEQLLPAGLVSWMLERAPEAAADPETLQRLRNARSESQRR